MEVDSRVSVLRTGGEPATPRHVARGVGRQGSGDVTVPVLGPEDVVRQKLAGYRLGGGVSERPRRDPVQVVRAGGLDAAYHDDVASTTGLEGLLARARGEAR